MLRAIADIARENGEDLRSLEPRLACLEVFALGDRKTDAGAAIGYYAARAALTKLKGDVVLNLVERTVLYASAPVVARLVTEFWRAGISRCAGLNGGMGGRRCRRITRPRRRDAGCRWRDMVA